MITCNDIVVTAQALCFPPLLRRVLLCGRRGRGELPRDPAAPPPRRCPAATVTALA